MNLEEIAQELKRMTKSCNVYEVLDKNTKMLSIVYDPGGVREREQLSLRYLGQGKYAATYAAFPKAMEKGILNAEQDGKSEEGVLSYFARTSKSEEKGARWKVRNKGDEREAYELFLVVNYPREISKREAYEAAREWIERAKDAEAKRKMFENQSNQRE